MEQKIQNTKHKSRTKKFGYEVAPIQNSKFKIQNSAHRGFSLFELIIYVAILSGVMVIIANTLISLSKGRGQAQARSEVNSAIRFATERIRQDLKSATSTLPITTPILGETSSTLKFVTSSSTAITYSVVGGQLVRNVGSYNTWNPADKNAGLTLSNGNLTVTQASTQDWRTLRATVAMSTGKRSWETTILDNSLITIGIATSDASLGGMVGLDAFGWGFFSGQGAVFNAGERKTEQTVQFVIDDVIRTELDLDNLTLRFFKNNVAQTPLILISAGPWFPAISLNATNSSTVTNFGATPFVNPPTVGFNATSNDTLSGTNVVVSEPTFTRIENYNSIFNATTTSIQIDMTFRYNSLSPDWAYSAAMRTTVSLR